MLGAVAKLWLGSITFYSKCIKSGDCVLATVRPMGTLALSCEWNVTWVGPMIRANSPSALILTLLKCFGR